MSRREFTKRQKAEIVNRAMDAAGRITCEGCGLVLGAKPYEIDHIVAEALILDKTRPLTISEGQVLGMACCHRDGQKKTASDVSAIARAKRRELKRMGVKKPSSFPKPPAGYNPWTRRIEK